MTQVDFSERPFRVCVGDDEYLAETVIVATGASARQLGLESEQSLQGRGVSYCATCDGAFFRDKQVVVVGGGDSAMEEAMFLTRFATKVTVVHRRDEFRASQIMVDRARANEKIEFVTNAVVDEVLGDDEGRPASGSATPRPARRGEIEADGLFVAIGHDPNTKLFLDQLDHDEAGYLITKPRLDRDEHPGRVRRRRRAGPHLPAGDHRRRLGLHGRARRRALPRRAGGPPDGADRSAPEAPGQPTRAASLGRDGANWIDLLDPTARSCRARCRGDPRRALEQLLAPLAARRRAAADVRGARRLRFGVFLVAGRRAARRTASSTRRSTSS